MKKTFAILAALCAVSVFSVRAQEQQQETGAQEQPQQKEDKQIFTHFAIGIPIDMPLLPDGIGIIEFATTCTRYVQFRLGYSFFPEISATPNRLNQMFPGANFPTSLSMNGGKTINIGEDKMTLGWNTGGIKLFVDVFPGKKTGFHFTFGAFINPVSANNAYEVRADLSPSLKEAGFDPGRYNQVYFGFNDNDPTLRISPNQNGVVTVGLRTWAVRPYVGIGFGRAIDPAKRVRVSFDMGAIFWGSPTLVGNDYSMDSNGTIVAFTPERVAKTNDLASMAKPLEIVSKVIAYPMMKLNIFIRVF